MIDCNLVLGLMELISDGLVYFLFCPALELVQLMLLLPSTLDAMPVFFFFFPLLPSLPINILLILQGLAQISLLWSLST